MKATWLSRFILDLLKDNHIIKIVLAVNPSSGLSDLIERFPFKIETEVVVTSQKPQQQPQQDIQNATQIKKIISVG